jgi:ABC-2 type transport system ATP-binding protein
VLGHPSALDAKDRIGYLPEERGVYRRMRVGAFLSYMAQLKGVPPSSIAKRVPPLLETIGLGGTIDLRCDDLSKGMLQRVQFLAAIIHQPDLLILDEPFSGLDPVSVRLLRDQIIAEHRRGATILLSTHVMPHAEALCQHVLMIHQGRKVLDQPIASLRRQFDLGTLLVEPLDPEADMTSIRQIRGVADISPDHGTYRVRLTDGVRAPDVLPLVAAAIPTARVEISRLHLEDVFIGIVSRGERTSPSATEQALRAELQG